MDSLLACIIGEVYACKKGRMKNKTSFFMRPVGILQCLGFYSVHKSTTFLMIGIYSKSNQDWLHTSMQFLS